MTSVCRAIRVKTGVPVIGLCHGVHYVEGVLARFLGNPEGSIASADVVGSSGDKRFDDFALGWAEEHSHQTAIAASAV